MTDSPLKIKRVVNGKTVEMNSSFMQGFTESYLADLGRVMAAWSHVEHSFSVLYLSAVVMYGKSSGSMSDPRVQRLMSAAFDRRINSFKQHLKDKAYPEDTCTKTTKVLDRLSTLRKKRDEIAHAAWTISISKKGDGFVIEQDKANALTKSWKDLKPFEQKSVTQNELKTTFEKMHVLFWDLFDLSIHRAIYAPPLPPP